MQRSSPFLVTLAAASAIVSGATASQATQDSPDRIDARVAALIEQVVKRETQAKALRDLESLGCAAVPSMIRSMNDHRKLPERAITFKK